MNQSDIDLPSNKIFGFFFTALFLVIGTYLLSENVSWASVLFFVLATLFLIVTLKNAESLLPLNKLWVKFGLLLGMIVNPIILAIIFFGLFTPISFLMKIFGRDELSMKLSMRTSHWKERNMNSLQADAFKKQF